MDTGNINIETTSYITNVATDQYMYNVYIYTEYLTEECILRNVPS